MEERTVSPVLRKEGEVKPLEGGYWMAYRLCGETDRPVERIKGRRVIWRARRCLLEPYCENEALRAYYLSIRFKVISLEHSIP